LAVHLVKLAVGVDSVDHLRKLQGARRTDRDGRSAVAGFTRRRPRREAELLDGGSLYWVIKGAIRARQRLLALEDAVDEAGEPYCRLLLDPDLAATEAVPKTPFQGWRYLSPEQAPADRPGEPGGADGDDDALPPLLARALREIGLI
jgi:hypothetical protein